MPGADEPLKQKQQKQNKNKKNSSAKNKNQKNPPKHKKRGGGKRGDSRAESKRSPRGNRGRKRRSRQGPKLSAEERVVKKYENLLEQHANARRKYFDLFNRAEPQQKEKLERNFYKTLEDVRSFEQSLEGEEREFFLKRFHYFGEVDHTYSKNHELETEGEEPPEGPFEDPHTLELQKESNFSDDDEESSGTMDDYYAYKEGQ